MKNELIYLYMLR